MLQSACRLRSRGWDTSTIARLMQAVSIIFSRFQMHGNVDTLPVLLQGIQLEINEVACDKSAVARARALDVCKL